MCFNGRNIAIKFVGDYISMILKSKKMQLNEKNLKYQLLNKCIKDYQ